MFYNRHPLVPLALGLMICACFSATAEELYKYVNEEGVTVLDSHVPPQYVKNGYTILSSDGRVLEVVPRALTQDELAEEMRQQEIKAADAALMRLYGSPEDVERARDTKIGSLLGFISAAETNLERLFEQKREAEAEVAAIERAGERIPEDSLARISSIQSRIEQTQVEIEAKSTEVEHLRTQYAADLERVTELYSKRRQDGSS